MKSAEGSYPHPVVGNSDDVDGVFAPSLFASSDRRSLTLEFEDIDARNSTIDELVAARTASYVARVDCDHTGFRRSYRITGPQHTIRVSLSELHRVVRVEICAIALNPIAGYAPAGMHSDYGAQTFDVQPGELLAITDSFRVELEAEWDPLKAPIQSLMQIEKGQDEPGPLEVNFEMDKIIIRLCADDYDHYNLRKVEAVDLLHAAIVFPVLVAALSKIGAPEYSGQLWNDRLRALLAAKDLPSDEPIRAAQELLKLPVNRGLSCLDQLCEGGNDDD